MKTQRTFHALYLTTLTTLALSPATAQPAFNVTDLGAVNGSSEAFHINGNGLISGYWFTRQGAWNAVTWRNGVANQLPLLPGGNMSAARASSVNGEIVGAANTYGNLGRAFIYDYRGMRDLGTLGGGNSYAQSVNWAGITVGGAQNVQNQWRAIQWDSQGRRYDLGTLGGLWSGATDINARHEIAGWSHTPAGPTHATLWVNLRLFDLGTLGGAQSEAHGISGGDIRTRFGIFSVPTRVVGWADLNQNHRTPLSRGPVRRAFLWTQNRMTNLGTPYPIAPFLYNDPQSRFPLQCYGVDSYAYRVNGLGQSVGYCQLHTSRGMLRRAFYHNGTQAYDLNLLLPANSGWVLLEAWGINEREQIVGRGMFQGQMRGFLLNRR